MIYFFLAAEQFLFLQFWIYFLLKLNSFGPAPEFVLGLKITQYFTDVHLTLSDFEVSRTDFCEGFNIIGQIDQTLNTFVSNIQTHVQVINLAMVGPVLRYVSVMSMEVLTIISLIVSVLIDALIALYTWEPY